MIRSFTVQVTPEIVRDATKRFMWRQFRWSGVAALLIGLIIVGYYIYTDSYDWLGGFLSGVLLIFVAVFIGAYFMRLRQSLGLLQRMGDVSVHYELSEEGFSATSSLGSSKVRWEAMKGIWRFPSCWLLFMDRGTYVTVPLQGPSRDDLDFILSKIPMKDKEIK